VSDIVLHAPFDGWVTALDAVPDPVFADRLLGDGVAIEPLGNVVVAPCDATVAAVAPTGHSVTLRLATGADLLIHIGVDTVAMKGEGFTVHVGEGDRVSTGDPLIAFDLDKIVMIAPSAITPILLLGDGDRIVPLATDRRVAAGEPIARIERGDATAAIGRVGDDTAVCALVVPMTNGVHARPAARIVAALKPFDADVTIERAGRSVNARSVAALLGGGIVHGDEIVVRGRGVDARAAVTAVASLIESGMGETAGAPAAAVPRTNDGGGVSAAPGFAVGPAFIWRVADIAVPADGADADVERAALDAARAAVAERLTGDGIADAHRALLADPELTATAETGIAAGRSAAFAWRAATAAQAAILRDSDSPLLSERAADLDDIGRQVVMQLTGEAPPAPVVPDGAVVIADELLPSDIGKLDPARVAGICCARGGPTSHAAILAAAAGIPMIVAAGSGVLDIVDGTSVILDADHGTIDRSPSPAAVAEATHKMVALRDEAAVRIAAAAADCYMADGTRIEVFANIGHVDDAARAVRQGAEGCGLLRTEFLFLDRDTAPTEAEQREIYAAIAAALDGRPLIVRTLDVGGDKPLPYLPFPPEDNPALGQRGVRFSLAYPDLLRVQLRAILTGVPGGQVRIMLPMVVDVDDVRRVRAILDEECAALGIDQAVPLGVMIETPAAAMVAAGIAREADFLSVGTNDLTQYALAADRGNPAVAGLIDALHPAVLALIEQAARGGAVHGRWIGVCGGLASNPRAAAILIGLGATELSAVPAAVPAVKQAVAALTMAQCRSLAAQALRCATAREVRALIGDPA